tara:strand:+ start:75 stop:539 length:465 start_codon:yes stop_codon:yes gene_type:complete
MSVLIRDLQKEDLVLMAEMMRPMDRFEFDLMSNGQSVEECLQHMLRRSRRARAGYFDGKLVAVYGVLSPTMMSTGGNPWMAATDMIDRSDVRRLFLQKTRSELAWLSEGFSLLWNIVSVENSIAIRWLKWVGFTFDGTEYDIRGHSFLKFQMEE